MNTTTGTLNGRRQAKCQFQRVQVSAFRIKQARLVALAGDPLRQLLTGNELQSIVTPFVARLVLPLGQQAHPARHHRCPEVAGPIITIEFMPVGQRAQFLRSPAHAVPQAPRTLITQRGLQRRHIARPTENGLAAITPRRCPSHSTGFQQRHALARQGQSQCRVQTTEAGADDQHFGVVLALQRRTFHQAICASVSVVAGDMTGGLLKHASLMKFYYLNFMKKYTRYFTNARTCRSEPARDGVSLNLMWLTHHREQARSYRDSGDFRSATQAIGISGSAAAHAVARSAAGG
ncbi:hypothetical protein D3C84_671810 [compost metagenome]